METWALVNNHGYRSNRITKVLAPVIISLSLIAFTSSSDVSAAKKKKRQDLRLYKVNKDGISQRLRFTKHKSKREGCQNLLLKSRVFKVSQFGFKYCVMYSKKNCEAGSEMSFEHPNVDQAETIELSQGYAWLPIGEHDRGERMKSWMCIDTEEQL